MGKRLGLVAALTACLLAGKTVQAQDASSCNIDTLAEAEISDVLGRYQYGFESYDSLCEALASANMGVALNGTYGRVSDRSYGLITVTVFDRVSEVESNVVTNATALDAELTTEAGEIALVRAINEAMQLLSTEPQRYIQSVRAESARLQAHFLEQ